ncbi:MAG: FliH/SctL family protein [Myxococcota bacterium]
MGDREDRDRDVRPAVFGDRSARARPAPWARGEQPEVRPWLPPGREPSAEEEPPADAEEAEAPPEPPDEPPGEDGEAEVRPAGPPDAEVPQEEPEPGEVPAGPCRQCETVREEAAAERDALLDALQDPYLRAAAELGRVADELSEGFHDAVIDLTVKLAGAVIERGVSLDREVLTTNLRRALEIAGPVSAVTLRCHPEDAEAMREEAPDLLRETAGRPADVTVRPSDDVERGACIVLFDEGIVDARWSQQLERLADAVRKVVQTHRGRGGDAGEEAE